MIFYAWKRLPRLYLKTKTRNSGPQSYPISYFKWPVLYRLGSSVTDMFLLTKRVSAGVQNFISGINNKFMYI